MLTELRFKDVRPVARFNEHDLILVCEVKRLAVVRSNREVKCGSVDLGDRRELSYTHVLLSNQLRPPESKLCVAGIPSGNEH